MAQLVPLFLDTGSIEVVAGNRIVDFIHFHVTASNISSSYTTTLPDPYLFATMSVDLTDVSNSTSTSLFEFNLANRQENYFYPHNSIVGVSTSATATGVRIGLQTKNSADSVASIKVSSTLTAHTIANIGTQSPTTFALPASMAAITTIYPSFVKGLYNNSTASAELKNIILLQSETNNVVTARSGSVSYNKFAGYKSDLLNRTFNTGTGFDTSVRSIAIQTDGKIVVGGFFTSYNGTAQNFIIRLNSDGTRDTGFTIGTGFDNTVLSIAIQTDGKILVGGDFTSYNGTTQNRITRLFTESTANQKSIPLYLSSSLKTISGSDTLTSSFLPSTSSLWLSQSLAANVANTSNTVYATVFSLTGLEDNKKYLANLYMIGQSAAAATGFRMRVQNGSSYRGTLYTPTSTTAPAIRNSEDGTNITSAAAATWPTVNTKYLVFGEYTFIKTAGTTPEVQILSETAGTAVTAFSGSVIFYRPIH